MKRKVIAITIGIAAGLCATTPAGATNDISVIVTPNPIGIPEVLIVIALLAFAIWQKGWIRMLLSMCIIVWGVFFIGYDIKMAAPALAVGSVLFVQAILAQIQQAREGLD